MEDLDAPRVVPGAADEILRALERYGLLWDGEVVFQSERSRLYDEALAALRQDGRVFACACSRAELARAASAPAVSDPVETDGPVYPGTCRDGAPAGKPLRSVRFRVPAGAASFDDAVFGRVEEETSRAVGDFVVRRADGPFAYQLAVVVDDASQGVTEVVRGADLLSSTARQILLQRALGLPTPAYVHLPLVLGPDGRKLGKRDGALPLATLDERRVVETLRTAFRLLGQDAPAADDPAALLAEAVARYDVTRVPRGPVRADGPNRPEPDLPDRSDAS